MPTRLFALLLLVAAAPAVAQPLTPEQIAERIDHYRFEPRAPGTYRALAGLGDPDRAPEPADTGDTPASDRFLLARMLPDQQPLDGDYWILRPGSCRTDYALSVARARVARFGASHPYVEQWLRTQRAVFGPCRQRERWDADDGPRPAPVPLPPPLATSDPGIARVQREDRAYQAAAALFYRGDPGARRAFAAIAASASPHAHIARYMLAALHVGETDFYRWDESAALRARRDAAARRALGEAQAILADPALADVHPLAQGLIGFLGYHMADERTRTAQVDATLDALEAPLARIEAQPSAADRYERARDDVGRLHRRFEDEAWWLRGTAPADAPASRAMAEQARTRPLAAFLLFPVSPYERDPWVREPAWNEEWNRLSEYAAGRSEDESGEAWALIRTSIDNVYDREAWTGIDALVRATQAAPTDRRLAAVATRFYHQVRRALIFDRGEEREARDEAFRAALARVEAWPWRDGAHHRELVYDMLQFLVARGRLDEARLVRDRTDPRGELYYGATAPILLLLAEDEDRLAAEITAMPERGQELLNLLSTDALARLAAREQLPAPLRARFARVAWSRLYALDRRIPEPLDLLMRTLNPEITAGWASRPGARLSSRPLLLDVLRSPGLNIVIAGHQRGGPETMGYADAPGLTAIDTYEHSDNNWWCAWQPQRHALNAAAAMYDSFFAPGEEGWSDRDSLAAAGAPAALGALLRSSFLWRSRDEAELAALAAIPSAPQRLAERAVAWRGSGSRAGQDEALALAVRATRYGCQRQSGHGSWSRAAHALLHARFPGSAAVRRTRWWFDCSHFSGGCPATREEDPNEWERWTRRRYSAYFGQ